MIRGCTSDRVSAETLHDKREVRERGGVGELFTNQTERANVELRLSDRVVQKPGACEEMYKVSREILNVFFARRSWFDFLRDKLRHALREIAVLFSEKRK